MSNFINIFLGETVWNMVDFSNIVKNMTIFEIFVLSREIRDLRTCNPGVKKFLNSLKNRFLSSESIFELAMGHCGICKICKIHNVPQPTQILILSWENGSLVSFKTFWSQGCKSVNRVFCEIKQNFENLSYFWRNLENPPYFRLP